MSAFSYTEILASGGNFLVTPELGLMLWTLLAFGVSMFLLRKLAYPRIQSALEKRARAVAESIDAAERTRQEADQILQEYRERLREAREQADEIVSRARKAADKTQDDARITAKETREEITSIQWLGFALTEAIVFYAFIFGLIAFFLS